VDAKRKELTDQYRAKFANPYKAAELGYVDEVISPELLRPRLVSALEMLRQKRQTNLPRKHGNIPL
jgi:propionyl-CoA carboxylase beta chain